MKIAILLPTLLAVPLLTQAQPGRGSWTTFGGDPQRSGWNKTETDLTPETVKHLKLEWSVQLDSEAKALSNLTAPLVRASVATPKGVKDLVIVAGASNKVFVIDGDTGKIFWEKTLSAEGTPARRDSWLCPNGLTATPVIGPVPRTPGIRTRIRPGALCAGERWQTPRLQPGEWRGCSGAHSLCPRVREDVEHESGGRRALHDDFAELQRR